MHDNIPQSDGQSQLLLPAAFPYPFQMWPGLQQHLQRLTAAEGEFSARTL